MDSTTATEARIAVHCDACGRDWRVPANLAGHDGKCACGRVLIVPHAEAPPGTVLCPHCGRWTRPEGWCEWCSEPLESHEPADLPAVHAAATPLARRDEEDAPGGPIVARTSVWSRLAGALIIVPCFGGALLVTQAHNSFVPFGVSFFTLLGAIIFWLYWTVPDEVVADAEGLRWRRRGREKRCAWPGVRYVGLPNSRGNSVISTANGYLHFFDDNVELRRLLEFARRQLATRGGHEHQRQP
jgi:hypothetical protein